MIQLTDHGMYLVNGVPQETAATDREEARRRTMAWQILQAHNESPDPMQLRIRLTPWCPTTSPMWASSSRPGPPA